MSRRNLNSKEMVSSKHKNKVLLSSTPEHRGDSPSRDSDSTICGSEAGSPVPFLCTQDGAEGETDVVWNFYTPKSDNTKRSREKNSTPLSRRSKRSLRPKLIEKHIIPRKRTVKQSQKNTEVFQELLELNKNLNELLTKKQNVCSTDKPQSGSEDDIFNESLDCSPKCIPKSSSLCLRRNVLSSNFGRPENETEAALESDDSMNEYLLKASQIVEEKILNNKPIPAKRSKYERPLSAHTLKTDVNFKLEQYSMDAILNSIQLGSPALGKVKKMHDSPCLNNDSFDSLVGNLNDSTLVQLTQMPIKTDLSKSTSKEKNWMVKELIVHDGSPSSKSFFGRHNSMPESPSFSDAKPSTSGMVFGRYSSMPYNDPEHSTGLGDSPITCTPDEIKKKHQLAREKLMAKRLLPFTSTQKSLPAQLTQQILPKKTLFQPKSASSVNVQPNCIQSNNSNVPVSNQNGKTLDLKQLIEKKRQEALMKLRRRKPQSK